MGDPNETGQGNIDSSNGDIDHIAFFLKYMDPENTSDYRDIVVDTRLLVEPNMGAISIENAPPADFNMYPNPATVGADIIVENVFSDGYELLKVFGMTGTLMGDFKIDQDTMHISTEGFTPGVYWLHFVRGSEPSTFTQRIVVEAKKT